jgi:2-polyprenyl-6-methoxyphenol hydroxylase-like FAD-dependent oxidoreductase
MRSPRLLVIGGGIGGLATALAASASGCEVHVLEKAERFAEIGAGLQLAPNASRVLDTLGILGDVRKHACFPPRLVVMDAVSGRELTSVEAGHKFAERYGYPYFVVHRADLLDAEVAACEKRAGIEIGRAHV